MLFGSLKAKQSILVSKIILTDPYVTSRDLKGRKPYYFRVHVSSTSSEVVLAACRRTHFNSTERSLKEVCLMYWPRDKSQIVEALFF